MLDDVTKTLPDDTWLTQFDVRGAAKGKEPRRELLLRGESANAGRLVSLLEDSKAFIDAAPRSPTTKIQPGPGEIFDLAALVAPVPPPPPVQLVSSSAPDARRGAFAPRLRRRRPPHPPRPSRPRRRWRPRPQRPLRLHPRCRCPSWFRPQTAGASGDAGAARHSAASGLGAAAGRRRAADVGRQRATCALARRSRGTAAARKATRNDRRDRTPPAERQRALAIALLVVAALLALAVLLLPILLLHKHYDDAIASLTDRLDTYRRVAAQAPEYRKALEMMHEKDGRRFFLKNTAPNLAGAELQELVRAAIEGNGGRITTSQNQPPKDDGRFRQIGVNVSSSRRRRTCRRSSTRSRRSRPISWSRTSRSGRSTRFAASSPRRARSPRSTCRWRSSATRSPKPPKPPSPKEIGSAR